MVETAGRGYSVKFPEAERVSRELVKSLLPDAVHLVATRARANAPRQTGGLAESIEERVEEDVPRGAVAATARHSFIIHQGTKSHPAMAKNSRALTIYTGGAGVVFRKSMEHPGTKGQPFLTDAIEDSRQEIAQALQGNEGALKRAIEDAS